MLKQLFTKYFDNLLYIKISSETLTVTDIITGREFCQSPYIATEKDNKGKEIIKAIGTEAKALSSNPNIEVTNPFLHPRLLIANFQKAEKILRHAAHVICKKKLFPPSPRVVIHPLEKLEGGLTDIEIRVFRELCLGTGAREVVVYVGAPLSVNGFDFEQVKKQGI
jgi:rod shape-determining protein MreB and related proteins